MRRVEPAVPEDHLLSLTQKNIYAMELISQIARVFRAAQLPLSDEQLAQQLKAEGLAVARRTVAKYREQLNIPSSSLRKKHL